VLSSPTTHNLSWTASVPTPTTYIVAGGPTQGGPWSFFGSTAGGTNNITGTTTGTYYYVAPYDGADNQIGPTSNVVQSL
jgi:hypothetical protein